MHVTVLAAGVVVALLIAVGAFAVGRASAPKASEFAETSEEIVVRLGDQLRVPAVGVFCTADVEIDRPRLLCNRHGNEARYQVVFERDRTKIGRLGFPSDQRTFLEGS